MRPQEIRLGVPELTTAETNVGVPHTRTALGVRVDVPFDDDGASGCSTIFQFTLVGSSYQWLVPGA